MNITKRYSFATEQESICTCAAVEAWAGEYVLYSDFNKLEMHLLKTQAKLMRAYAEINKLRDPGGCDHEFEILPNGVIQCLKCGFAHV